MVTISDGTCWFSTETIEGSQLHEACLSNPLACRFPWQQCVPHMTTALPFEIPTRLVQVGGVDNGGQLARGLDVPGTDKLPDYVHAVQKLPDTDHVRQTANTRAKKNLGQTRENIR